MLQCHNRNEFAILTAGHVAIKLFDVGEQFTKIGFFNETTYEVKHGGDSKLFIANDYIKYGTCDVGALVIRLKEGPPENSFENLFFPGAPSFDTKFIGRSFDFCFQSYPFRVVGDRVGLRTPCTEGCSGTPMFSSKGELLSVLHGERQYHGRKQFFLSKKSGNKKDLESFYVDTVKELSKLKLWDQIQFDNFIKKVEQVDEICNCKNVTKRYRKTVKGDVKYEFDTFASKFYKEMRTKLGGGHEKNAFMNCYFTIPEICCEVIRHVQNPDVESLDQYLFSPKKSTYKACAHSEQF